MHACALRLRLGYSAIRSAGSSSENVSFPFGEFLAPSRVQVDRRVSGATCHPRRSGVGWVGSKKQTLFFLYLALCLFRASSIILLVACGRQPGPAVEMR